MRTVVETINPERAGVLLKGNRSNRNIRSSTVSPVRKTLPTFTCGYSDEYDNDWDLTYTADGDYEDAGPVGETGYSYGSAPQITITAVEISGHVVPVKAFSRHFIDVLEEHCAEHHVEEMQAQRDYEESEHADRARDEK